MRIAVALLFAVTAVGTAQALPRACDLPVDLLRATENGTLLVLGDDSRWTKFEGFGDLKRPLSMSFAFVVKDDFRERSGVVAIKTAQPAAVRKTAWSGVKLVRTESSGDTDCTSSVFDGGTVSVRAYEDYHGKGWIESSALDAPGRPNGSDRKTIDRFHTRYMTARGCRSSDATAYDGSFEYRNNRSQFSFDTSVVDNGWSYATTNLALSLIPSALAAAPKLHDQGTEIRHYKVAPDVPACVRFELRVSGTDQVLRINDIEDRGQGFRAPERRWPSTQP